MAQGPDEPVCRPAWRRSAKWGKPPNASPSLDAVWKTEFEPAAPGVCRHTRREGTVGGGGRPPGEGGEERDVCGGEGRKCSCEERCCAW